MKVRLSLYATAALAVFLHGSALPAAATTWLVPGDGSNTCTTGSPNCNAIAQAVAASADNDTIQIAAGSFPVTATIALTNTLTIVGAGLASTTVAVDPDVVAFDVQADGMVIQDLTIQGGSVGVRFPATSDDTEIDRVKFDTNTSRGIEISPLAGNPVTNVSIVDATFSASSIGLRMASNSTVDGLSITGSTFTGNGYGIYQANDGNTSSLTNFAVDGCTFTNNANYHIYSEEMRDASIEDSSFTGGTNGVIIIKFYASNGLPISNVAFRRNQFTGFTGNALDLEMLAMGLGSPITIEGNTIVKNVGIQTSPAAVFVRPHPAQLNGAVNFVDNEISLTGTFGAGTAAHAVQLRGNGPVTFTGNILDGGNVGGSGTTPATSGIFIESRIGGTQMPATASFTGSCNLIKGFHNGVSVFSTFANAYGGLLAGSTVSFANDSIIGNDAAGVANGATPTLDFENNWWGCAAGPGNPGCDGVVGAVDTAPNAVAPPACVGCVLDTDCEDDQFCTGAETCNLSGQCVAAGDPCTGGSQCNDVCNEAANNCVAPNGTGCDDADVCTLADVCTAGVCGGGSTCGDGIIQGGCGEICDDGNPTSNDGCSATCQFEFVCTPAPLVGCRVAASGKSQFQVKNKSPDLKDQLQWKWSKGAIVTPKADYGTPTSTTEYRLCVYAGGSLVSRETIPAGGMCAGKSCWKETKTGFIYKDKDATPDGITGLNLKEGLAPGKAKIGLKGKGANLDTPTLPLALPVIVQLRNSNGVCFETTHSAPAQKNDGAQYKDKSD